MFNGVYCNRIMGSCEEYTVNQKKHMLDRMHTVWRKDDYRIAWFHLVDRQCVYMMRRSSW